MHDPPSKKSHSVGITVDIMTEHYVSTTWEDCIKLNTVDKETSVKPDPISTKEVATQTESPNVTFFEASTMTDEINDDSFWIEKIKDDQMAVHFYTQFPSMKLLKVWFTL